MGGFFARPRSHGLLGFFRPKGEIHISKSLCTETLQFKETKTEAGHRCVPLDPGTVAYLKKFRAIQAPKYLALGKSMNDSPICAEPDCDYMHPENLTRAVRDFSKASGIRTVTPHILRHTYCTLLFHAGADLKTAQYLMGHADPAVTLRIYTHFIESNGEKAAAAVGALMDSLPDTNVIEINPRLSQWGLRAVAV